MASGRLKGPLLRFKLTFGLQKNLQGVPYMPHGSFLVLLLHGITPRPKTLLHIPLHKLTGHLPPGPT